MRSTRHVYWRWRAFSAPGIGDAMCNDADNSPLSRRAFIATTSAVALSQILARADVSHSSGDLAAHIHSDVQIHRDELAKNDNAFWVWKDAVSRLTPLHEFATRTTAAMGIWKRTLPPAMTWCGASPQYDYRVLADGSVLGAQRWRKR